MTLYFFRGPSRRQADSEAASHLLAVREPSALATAANWLHANDSEMPDNSTATVKQI
jgi:hypothetical protein